MFSESNFANTDFLKAMRLKNTQFYAYLGKMLQCFEINI